MKKFLRSFSTCIFLLFFILSFVDLSWVKAHSHAPTHPTLMEYAVEMAKDDLGLPIYALAKTRLIDGSRQEDTTWHGLGRFRNHAYNPLTDRSFTGPWPSKPARQWAYEIWNDMIPLFDAGILDLQETATRLGGAWQRLGRVSHVLQDMSSPLHVFAKVHGMGFAGAPSCFFEDYWEDNDSLLRNILNDDLLNKGALRLNETSGLPPEALERLGPFSRDRLNDRVMNSSPNKGKDVRGYIEVLAWITYFNTTFWGEVVMGSQTSWGYGQAGATSTYTETSAFPTGGHVDRQINELHRMFEAGNVLWRRTPTDNYFRIDDRDNDSWYWMSWTRYDDWGACGDWSEDHIDGSMLTSGSSTTSKNARTVGRFWFDSRGYFNKGGIEAAPRRYPDGSTMDISLLNYFGRKLFPLTVRYNAGLLSEVFYTLNINSTGASALPVSSTTGHQGTTGYTLLPYHGTIANLIAPEFIGSDMLQKRFSHWSGDISSSNLSINVTMNENKTVTANYVSDTISITSPLSVTSTGASRVIISSDTGHEGLTDYTTRVGFGTWVSLTAPEYTGSGQFRKRFSHWSGGDPKSNTIKGRNITFRVTIGTTATAHYVDDPADYSLQVVSYGAPGVLISNTIIKESTKEGFNEYTDYAINELEHGSEIYLWAPQYLGTGVDRKRFEVWKFEDEHIRYALLVRRGKQDINFIMDSDKEIAAVYSDAPQAYRLTVMGPNASNLNISSSTGHGGAPYYSKLITHGAEVVLEAPKYCQTGEERLKFSHWSECESSEDRVISFNMTSNKTCIVNYSYSDSDVKILPGVLMLLLDDE
jgi:hypothetical protein